jgi:hypothetical protein
VAPRLALDIGTEDRFGSVRLGLSAASTGSLISLAKRDIMADVVDRQQSAKRRPAIAAIGCLFDQFIGAGERASER